MRRSGQTVNIQETVSNEEYDERNDRLKKVLSWAKSIGIQIQRGNFIIGNRYLPTASFITFQKAEGSFYLEKANNPSDLYKVVFNFKVHGALWALKENKEVKVVQTEFHQKRMELEPDYYEETCHHFRNMFKNAEFEFLNEEVLCTDYADPNIEKTKMPFSHKYPENYEVDKKIIRNQNKIMKCASVNIMYYYDKCGKVSEDETSREYVPPEYGIDIQFGKFENSSIIYGSWAEHQRSMIQQFFYPNTFEDALVIERIPGRRRQYEYFDVKIGFTAETIWHFPFKRTPRTLKEKQEGTSQTELLSIYFSTGTCMVWKSPQGALAKVAKTKGYSTDVSIDFRQIRVVTSETNSLFLEANSLQCRFNLQSAVAWNGLRDWVFNFELPNATVYYLAAHMQFIRDLLRDRGNYPNSKMPTIKEFIPYKYTYKIGFRKVDLILHANNYNIIERFNQPEDNIFFHIVAPTFDINVEMDYSVYQPNTIDYKFEVNVESSPSFQPYVQIDLPESHPLKQKIGNEPQQFLRGDRVNVSAVYTTHYKVHKNNLDRLKLNLDINTAFILFNGAYFSYLITMWYNYFTIQKSFETEEEFIMNGYKNDKSKQLGFLQNTDLNGFYYPYNDMEYIITLDIKKGSIQIPFNLYTVQEEMANLKTDSFFMEIRYIPTYLDLSFKLSPILFEAPLFNEMQRTTYIGVDGVEFWGQVAVGVPPDGHFYAATINLLVGDVTGELTFTQVGYILVALQNFVKLWSSAYPPNKTLDKPPIYLDRIYHPSEVSKLRVFDIKVQTKSISVFISNDSSTVHVSLKNGVRFTYDTLIDGKYNKKANVEVTDVGVKFYARRETHIKLNDGDFCHVGGGNLGIRLKIKSKTPSVLTDEKKQKKFLHDQGGDSGMFQSLKDKRSKKSTLPQKFKAASQMQQTPSSSNIPTPIIVDMYEDVKTIDRLDSSTFYDIDSDEDYTSCSEGEEESVKPQSKQAQQQQHRASVLQENAPTGKATLRSKELLKQYSSHFIKANEVSQEGSSTKTEGYDSDEESINDTLFFYNHSRSSWQQFLPYNNFQRYFTKYDVEQDQVEFCMLNHAVLSHNRISNNTITGANSNYFQTRPDFGLYSSFPDIRVKEVQKGKLNLSRDDNSYPSTMFSKDMFASQVNRKASGMEFGTLSEDQTIAAQTSEQFIHLEFCQNVSAIITPTVVSILSDVIKAVVAPFTNLNDIADSVEKNVPKVLRSNNEEEVKEPAWLFNKTIFSCYLEQIKIAVVHSIYSPSVLKKSPLLGKISTHQLQFTGEHFFTAVSVCFKNEVIKNEVQLPTGEVKQFKKVSKGLHDIDLVVKLNSLQVSSQCLNKTKNQFNGLEFRQSNIPSLKFLLPNRPTTLFGGTTRLEVCGKLFQNNETKELQGRFTLRDENIFIHLTEELPSILMGTFELWRQIVTDLFSKIQSYRQRSAICKIVLLHEISMIDREEDTTRRMSSPSEASFISSNTDNQFNDLSIEDSIVRVRRKLKSLSLEQKQAIARALNAALNNEESHKPMKKRIMHNYLILLKEPHKNIAASGPREPSTFSTKNIRIDVSIDLSRIGGEIHSFDYTTRTTIISEGKASNLHLKLKAEDVLVLNKNSTVSQNQVFDSLMGTSAEKELSITAVMSVGEGVMDVHPQTAYFITCIIGIVLTIKAKKLLLDSFNSSNIKKNLQKIDAAKTAIQKHIRPKTVSIARLDDIFSQNANNAEIIDQITNSNLFQPDAAQTEKQSLVRRIYVFVDVLVEKLEARAWMDQFNFAELSIGRINALFNRPKSLEQIQMSSGVKGQPLHQVKLDNSGSINISKIEVQYNFSNQGDENFTSLFDAVVEGINANEFWFRNDDKDNIHIVGGFKSLEFRVPFTEIWAATTIQFRKFVQTYYDVIREKPTADPNIFKDSMNTNSARNSSTTSTTTNAQSSSATENTEKNLKKSFLSSFPKLNIVLDFQQIVANLMILPTLQMRYIANRVLVTYHQPDLNGGSFRLHLYPNSIAFKTSMEDEFPSASEVMASPKGGATSGTSSAFNASHAQRFKRRFEIPEVYIHGTVDLAAQVDGKSSRLVNTSIAVGYMENVVTNEILNYVLFLQASMRNEIVKLVEVLTQAVESKGKDISNRIKTELPKAQDKVSSLNLSIRISLLLEGVRLTALGSTTAIVFDMGSTKVMFQNRLAELFKQVDFSVSLSKLQVDMIDLHKMKFSTIREYQGKYSDTSECYPWASFVTNVKVQNFSNGTTISQETNGKTSTKKFQAEIRNTHVYLRPGSIDQAVYLFKDFQQAFSNVRQRFVEVRDEYLKTKAISSLVKTGEQYYSYYSKQIVEQVAKDPTVFISSGIIKVYNTTVSMPMGDNPYYGFLANQNPNFIPTSSIQVLLKSIEFSGIIESDDELIVTIDPLMVASSANLENKEKVTVAKQVGVCIVSTICIYYENLAANNRIKDTKSLLNNIPSLTKYETSANRCKIEQVLLSVDVKTTPELIRTIASVKIAGPEIRATPYILTQILNLKDDWINTKRGLYNDPLQFTSGSTASTKTEEKTNSGGTVVASLTKRVIHVSCRVKLDQGNITLCHSQLQDVTAPPMGGVVGDHLFNAFTSKQQQQTGNNSGSHNPSSIALQAKLPVLMAEIVHLSPAGASQNASGEANRSNTHLQIGVTWSGAKLGPQSVHFIMESVYIYRTYEAKEKERKKSKLFTKSKSQSLQQQDTKILKPITWMNLLHSVILIQRVFRGHRARSMYQKVKRKQISLDQIRSPQKKAKKTTAKDPFTSTKSDTFSFLFRIEPFKVQFTCSPISDVVTAIEFNEPFSLLFTRAYRSVQSGNIKGNALHNTIFISLPIVLVRLFHHLSPNEFAVMGIRGIQGNIGIGYGSFLRIDAAAVMTGTVSVDQVFLEVNVPQMNEFFIIYSVYMDKLEESKALLGKLYGTSAADRVAMEEMNTVTNSIKQITKKRVQEEELSLDATSSRFGQIFITEIRLVTDLGVAVGKQQVTLKGTSFFLGDRGRFENASSRDPLHLGAYVSTVQILFTGRLRGQFVLEGAAIGLDRQFRTGGGKQSTQKGTSEVCVKILPIHFELEYNNDMILMLQSGEMVGKWRDRFDSPDGKQFHVQNVLSMDGMVIRLSRVTAPSFIKLFLRVKDKVLERRQVALETILSSLSNYKKSSSSSSQQSTNSTSIEKGLAKQLKSLSMSSPMEQLLNLIPVGDTTILGRNVFVYLYDKFDIGTNNRVTSTHSDWIEFCLADYRVNLARICDKEREAVVRLLTIFVTGIAVDRVGGNNASKSYILQVPGAYIEMESSQTKADSSNVDYVFHSKFPDPIRVTVNLSEYNFLRSLVTLYKNEVQKELKNLQTSQQQQQQQQQQTASLLQQSSVTTRVSSREDLSMEDSQESLEKTTEKLKLKPNRTFVGTVDLNPKLNVLGDMTPKVETVLNWLGIKDKNTIPRHTHNFLTDNLEYAIIGCYHVSELLDKFLNEK